jgi:O-acetyl-ADP-ribose deacetylase (regulator of RNase III)
MPDIEVVLGDITRESVDAIVNAANLSLRGGGGVDGAIHRAAGPELARAGAMLAPCRAGDAKATPAFGLAPRITHVIHTVGPVWRGGDGGEPETLASCYRRCLEVADELGAGSVAFPAISTGIYGFPGDEAARIAVRTLRETPTGVSRAETDLCRTASARQHGAHDRAHPPTTRSPRRGSRDPPPLVAGGPRRVVPGHQ